jgi:hypothetical protein
MVAFRRSVFILFILLESLTQCAFAADADPSKVESLLHATYLYKFIDYVEWPAAKVAVTQPATQITIGVIDADAVAAALTTLITEHPNAARRMSVKILKANEPLADIQVLFVGHGSSSQIRDLLAGARDLPVLTVTAADGALDAGSIINFVVVDGHIKFEISVTQATRSGLKISSRLLAIAQKLDTGGK